MLVFRQLFDPTSSTYTYLLGDSAQLTYTTAGDLITVVPNASGVGGSDTIHGNDGNDVIIGGAAGDWLHVRDWSRELANQLLGRIKSQAVSHRMTFDIGTPSALTGDPARMVASKQSADPIRFVSGAALITVWFDVEISRDAAARLSTPKAEGVVKEGEVVLF